MKVRNDYVTNSSSSSFILAFESEDSIAKELAANDTKGKFEEIYNDVMSAEKYNNESILEKYRKIVYYPARYAMREYLECEKCMSFREIIEFQDTEEFEELLQQDIQRRVDELKEKLQDKSVIVMVRYSDHGSWELEHDVVPGLDCCMERISHH